MRSFHWIHFCEQAWVNSTERQGATRFLILVENLSTIA
jgi:hypothetical protein